MKAKQNVLKKAFSFILALAMLFTLAPLAWAQEAPRFTSFGFAGISAATVFEETEGAFLATIYVPEGTNTASLTPEFTTQGQPQVTPDGQTDFSSPVTYTLENGAGSATYTVTVQTAPDAPQKIEEFFSENFDNLADGEIPASENIFAAGTTTGARFIARDGNTENGYIKTISEENGNKAVELFGQNGTWAVLQMPKISKEQLADSESIIANFSLWTPAGGMGDVRYALLGYDENGNQYPTADEDGEDNKEVMFVTDTFIYPPKGERHPDLVFHHDPNPAVPRKWTDIQFKYVSENGKIHTFARAKNQDQTWDAIPWVDYAYNDSYDYKTSAYVGLSYAFGVTSTNYSRMDNISMSADYGKDLAPKMLFASPYDQSAEPLAVQFTAPLSNESLDKVRLMHGASEVPADKTLTGNGTTVLLTPREALAPGEGYQIAINTAADIYGNIITKDFDFVTKQEDTTDFPAFLSFGFEGVPGAAVIHHNALAEDGEITVTLAEGQDVTNLTAAYQLSDGTQVTAGQEQTDFSSPVTYTLEREGETKNYVVTISFAQDAAPQQKSLFTATFENDTPGEKPADAAIFASGTSSGGRYAVGGDNDAASYVTVAEEDGKKVARVQMGNAGLWSGLMTKSVTADELLGATELRLAFRMKLGEAPIANGRIALIGYNGDADALYQGDGDGGADMDLTYISEGVIWPCNHDSVPGTSIGWNWGGWADVEIKYEVRNGKIGVFARSKPVDAQEWQYDINFGNNNDGFNFDDFDRYAVVFTSGLTDQPGYYFIDDISLLATFGKDLAPALANEGPYNQEVDELKVLFKTPLADSELSKVKLWHGGEEIPSTKQAADDGKAVVITPKQTLLKNEAYEIVINGAKDIFGNTVSGTLSFMTDASDVPAYDELTPTGLASLWNVGDGALWQVETLRNQASGVLDVSAYTVESSDASVVSAVQAADGYRLTAKKEGVCAVTIKSPAYGELDGYTHYITVGGYEAQNVSGQNAAEQTRYGQNVWVTGQDAVLTYSNVNGNGGEMGQEFFITYLNLSGQAANAAFTANGQTVDVPLAASANEQQVFAAKASLPMNAGTENTITVAISQPGVTVVFAASRFGVDLAEVNAMTAQNAEILVPKYVANLSLLENYNLLTQSKKALVAQDMASLIAGGKQFATVDEVKSYLADAIAAAYDPSADNYTSFETFTLQNVKTSSIISDAQEENKGFVQLYVPEGTDVTNLTPVFTTTGQASVSPSGAQNFSGPVTYLVDNGEAVKQYTVTVTAAKDAQAVTNVLVEEDFESYGVGAKPNGPALSGAGTNVGGRYTVGGDNTAQNYVKVAEENGNQYAAFRAGENLWTLCGTRNVSSAEIADAKSLVLSFRLRWEEGSMQHGRLVLLGLDEEGLQYPSNNDDGDDYKELMYFTDTHFITPHSSGGPGGNMQYRSSATEPTRWIDVQIQYVSEGETTHTYARSKDASQAWGSAWTDLGVNKIFNFRDAANLTAVFAGYNTDPGRFATYGLDNISLTTYKKDLSAKFLNQGVPFVQDTDTLKIAFATQMENAELEKVQITKDGAAVESEKVLAQDGKTLSIIPKTALEKGGEYVLTVNEASDIFGNSIKETFTFTVAPEGYVRYDEVSLSGVPDVLWENTNETVSVNTKKDGAAGVLDASLYEVASSNQAVIKVTQQNGGYRLSAVGEGAATITVKSPLYGEINGFTKYVLVCDGYANKTVSSVTSAKAQTLFGETIYVTDENASITYSNVDGNEGESAQEFWISYVNLSGKQAAAKVTANGKTQTVTLEKSKNSQDVKAVKVSVSMQAGAVNQVTLDVDRANVSIVGAASVFGADLAAVHRVTTKTVQKLFNRIIGALSLSGKYDKLTGSQKLTVQGALLEDVSGGKRFASIDELRKYLENEIEKAQDIGVTPGGNTPGGSTSNKGNQVTVGNTPEDNMIDQVPAARFSDMQGYEWAAEAVEALAGDGIVTGVANGLFAPGKTLTREEFVTMLVRLLGVHNPNATCAMADVASGAWYESYVASAMEAGLVKGFSETEFGTGAPITREQMATMIYRAAGLKGIALENGSGIAFSDESDISGYAKEAVLALCGAQILNGMGDGTFAPGQSANRAQAAQVIFKLSQLF